VARERVLTRLELNRALLARQLLLRRARLSIPRALERVGAVQAQWPPSPYIALWTRLEGFRPAQLMRALERRQAVKATLMRTTLHHMSATDYLSYAGVLRRYRSEAVAAQLEKLTGDADLDQLAEELVRLVSEEPRSRPELLGLLGLPKLALDRMPWLVWHLLAAKAALLHAPASSTWRLNTAGVKFVTAHDWLGRAPADGDEAVTHLVARYLAAFGPATRADASQWTGLPVTALEPAFERLPLRHFRDEAGRRLFDVPRAPLPAASTEAPPRFLPMWDSTLLAHDDRTRILPADYRSVVIRKNGDVQRTFLVDGVVAGLWSVEDGRVQLEPFERLERAARTELEREGLALAELHVARH
jgi:hypothetical protein